MRKNLLLIAAVLAATAFSAASNAAPKTDTSRAEYQADVTSFHIAPAPAERVASHQFINYADLPLRKEPAYAKFIDLTDRGPLPGQATTSGAGGQSS